MRRMMIRLAVHRLDLDRWAVVYLIVSGNRGLFAMFALLTVNSVLGWQFYTAARFWKATVTDVSKA